MKGVVFSDITPKKIHVLVSELERGEPLLSKFVRIPYFCEGQEGFVIGRITNFLNFNDLYKDDKLARTIKEVNYNLINQLSSDKLNALILEVELITAFSNNHRMPLSCPVSAGEIVETLDEKDLNELFTKHKDKLTYLGTFFNTRVPEPLYLQDFKKAGEGYHVLVAGQTGSGKSTAIMMLLSLYAKASKEMNFIVFDTVGEFSRTFSGRSLGGFWQNVSLKDVWRDLNREEPEILSIHKDLAFDTWEALRTLLIDNYVFEPLDVPRTSRPNTEAGVDFLINYLRKETGFTLGELYYRIDEILSLLKADNEKLAVSIYKGEERKQTVMQRMFDPYYQDQFKEKLESIFKLFDATARKTIGDIVFSLKEGNEGRTFVIDLSSAGADGVLIDSKVKKLLLKELVSKLSISGEQAYGQGKSLNTMVVLEEAHNYVPRREDNDPYTKDLSETLVKAYRETRKFGLGWLAITTRVAGIRREVFEHSRIKLIGMGLNTGGDLELLKEQFGNEFVETYRLFPDPTDPLSDVKKSCFMISGVITVLSRTQPEYVEMFSDVYEFLKKNGIRDTQLVSDLEGLKEF